MNTNKTNIQSKCPNCGYTNYNTDCKCPNCDYEEDDYSPEYDDTDIELARKLNIPFD